MKCVFLLGALIFRGIISHPMNYEDGDDGNIDLTQYGDKIYGLPDERAGENLSEWEQNRSGNPEESGTYLEGDILFPINQSTTSNGRNGIVGQSYRWTSGAVPFEIAGSYDAQSMSLIEKAMNSYHQNTCIKFKPRTSNERDYISIQNSASGCWSSVGRIGGRQVVNLQSPSCTSMVGTIIHELMHTVGFFHEQSREERDQYVTIMTANIRRGYEDNFKKNEKGTSTAYGVGYDYGSVMHYSEMAFSGNGKPTIQTKVKSHQMTIYSEDVSLFHIYRVKRPLDNETASHRKTSRKSTICTVVRKINNRIQMGLRFRIRGYGSTSKCCQLKVCFFWKYCLLMSNEFIIESLKDSFTKYAEFGVP